MKDIKLGTRIKDKVTDLEGIAIAKISYLNGCVQYSIKPKVTKDGKVNEGEWVDSQQVEIVDEGISIEETETGGYSSIAPKL